MNSPPLAYDPPDPDDDTLLEEEAERRGISVWELRKQLAQEYDDSF